ncbi:hypothetical protein LINPERHAP2_LOCUS6782 [Linum perenne]
MKRRLEYLWAKSGSIQVSDLSNNFYLVRFADQDDYSSAAFKGPWKIYDYYISVSQWSPSFDEEAPIKSILTWVRLPKLSIHYFNKVAVSRIGNSIGRTVRLDLATAEGSRGRYARVCVEIDVTKPLLGKFMIEDKVYKVEYESLENVCFDCGFYGHKREHCYSNEPHREKVDDKEAAPSTIPVTSTKDPDTGEWMTIQRRNRKKQAPPQVSASVVPAKTNNNNNTFSALQVEEPEVSQAAKNDQERTLELQTEKLRKVLEDALKESAQERPSASKGSKQKIRLALANITNLEVRGGDGKTDGKAASSAPEMFVPSMEDSRLVAVPVMYQNIAFQADSSEPKSAKAKPMLPRKTVTAKSKSPASSSNPSAYRRRVVKKKATISGQLVRTEPISKDIENDVHKTRKPPDRS